MTDKIQGNGPKSDTPRVGEPSQKEPGVKGPASDKETQPLGEEGKKIEEGAVTEQQSKAAEQGV